MATQDAQSFHWHDSEFDDSNFQIRGRTLFFVVVLLCVILLVTMVYLYARWVCRFGPPNSVGSIVHAPPRQSTTRPGGLDPSSIGNLPIVLHRDLVNPNEGECSICLGIFQDGDKVKVLPDCGHCYHCECVDKWLRTQSSCPLCRASLRVDSLV
ncbi:hypothetical protein M9H77_10825 [Catharanthus roseus]|uniref:Uncharacterized protein n=1 Tax=Catharanthus roseus TaxID=4058 RepID=A0ACC0BCV7_CATRO|nr:hypothetical protein M9H77_10825 [Catharanthus roseus]